MILSLHSHLQNQTFLICVTFNLLVCTLGEGLLAAVSSGRNCIGNTMDKQSYQLVKRLLAKAAMLE